MTRLDWGSTGKRFYEAGVDRGVLYVDPNPGVPWTGLISVTGDPDGGEVTSLYLDGVKFHQESSPTEWQGTVVAYASPVEFDLCDGVNYMAKGLGFLDQPRKQFGLSYRTQVGNDVAGLDLGYKVHLIYNASAEPTTRAYSTMDAATDAINLSWKIQAQAPPVTGYRPTAHLVVDSRKTSAATLLAFENIIYGSAGTAPRLPLPNELVGLFT